MSEPSNSERMNRVRRWLDRLRPFGDATHPFGQAARRELPEATGLSAASVDWALTHALEFDAHDAELQALVERVAPAKAAHVLLSANVFVGALRAIAIALASSEVVSVRSSRREPVTAALLHRAMPEAFTLVSTLQPQPHDHVWAYGADETLSRLRTSWPAGVVLHAHGSGHGVVFVDDPLSLTVSDFDAIALDIAAFDQRGCLSPRFVLFEGEPEQARSFATNLLAALTRIAKVLPVGTADAESIAGNVRHRELWRFLGEVYVASSGMVTLDLDGNPWGIAPTNRTVHVRRTEDPVADLVGLSSAITAVGSRPDPNLAARIRSACPNVRWSPFGFMQRPRLDGPADRRVDLRGIVL